MKNILVIGLGRYGTHLARKMQELGNDVVIIDKNNLQIDGCTQEVKSLEPLDEKLKAFGFN